MITLFIKYRYLFLLVSAVYLNFSLMLPIFHHHHEEENNHLDMEKYHSHILNDIHGHDNEHSTDFHSLEDIQGHSHFVNLNLAETGKVKRMFSSQITLVFIPFTGIRETKSYSNRLVKTEPEDKQRREKCVHSASNVSPPLI